MARTIESIEKEIIKDVEQKLPALAGSGSDGTTTSKTSEWKLWANIVATTIHAFEFILDLFRKEVDTLTNKITPGTVRWYAEMCKRFQIDDKLKFDENTALLYYEKEDDAKKIIKVASVSEGMESNTLIIKVAKYKDEKTKEMCELTEEEMKQFRTYMDDVKFAGCRTEIISTKADKIKYGLVVYYESVLSRKDVEEKILLAIEGYRTAIGFDGIFYRQQFLEEVMAVEGVVTCQLTELSRFSSRNKQDEEWEEVQVYALLDAGYFDYDKESVLSIESINSLVNGVSDKKEEDADAEEVSDNMQSINE